ncbi:MAG: hypothetical protein JRE16_01735 [Deltaproteobacteria bacterium]|jgi:hypothetical protein|nr:hypothetical protein [Deltaproteobacteria bacterium]MBW2503270.1 hypothetical protein [Deltaproteobacteria bacterium]MBW2520850.1 hypothetical protein [Deltaproteobacteria bacterium]
MAKTLPSKKSSQWKLFVGMLIIACLAGCVGIGPKTVSRDRFDYVTAISDSWKRQTLMNLLKTRYADAPVWMDVTSVINQYAVESNVQLAASWSNPPSANAQNIGGSTKYTDRPTITYSPLSGEKFTKSLMTPIPVPGILFLLQSGYPADYIFRICVHTVNGIENSYGSALTGRFADHDFTELIKSMAKIQRAGGLGMRVKPEGDDKAFVMFFRPLTDPEVASELHKVKDLLGLNTEAREFRVSYGSYSEDDTEIAILSRSMLQVMVDFASYIEVPDSDVAEGRVYATRTSAGIGKGNEVSPMVRVRSGREEPRESYVSVFYRDHWFWIEDRDYRSKLVFNFLMYLFSMTETGGQGAAPIVTVPTN